MKTNLLVLDHGLELNAMNILDIASKHKIKIVEVDPPAGDENTEIIDHDFNSSVIFPDLDERDSLDPDEQNTLGIDISDFSVDFQTQAVLTFVESNAGYENTLGHYIIDADGTIRSAGLAFENAKKAKAGDEYSFDLPGDPDTSFGFFLIANGSKLNKKFKDIDLDDGELQFIFNMGGDDERLANIADDAENITLVFVGGNGERTVLNGDVYHSTFRGGDTNLNGDDAIHTVSGLANEGDTNVLRIGFEDLQNLGDADFNDLIFDLDIREVEIVGIFGTAGDDILIDDGISFIDGRGGIDTLDYSGFTQAVNVSLNPLTQSRIVNIENIIGSDFADDIIGDNNDNVLRGGAGNDIIRGLGGNNTIYGDDGDDVVIARGGADTIYGGAGFDRIFSGDGDDIVYGGEGADIIKTSGGNDTVYGGAGDDQILGESGDDILHGDDGVDIVYGGAGNDEIHGGLGNDRLLGGDGDDTIHGDEGADLIFGEAGNDTVYGGADDDFVYGGLGNDILNGGEGNDRLFGGDGNDTLNGDAGNDRLYGDAGNDLLLLGDGINNAYGGAGSDTFQFVNTNGEDAIRDFTLGGAEGDYLDISNILDGFEEGVSDINSFVRLNTFNDSFSQIYVNEDGQGNDWVLVTRIVGTDFTGTNVDNLLADGTLIVNQSIV